MGNFFRGSKKRPRPKAAKNALGRAARKNIAGVKPPALTKQSVARREIFAGFRAIFRAEGGKFSKAKNYIAQVGGAKAGKKEALRKGPRSSRAYFSSWVVFRFLIFGKRRSVFILRFARPKGKLGEKKALFPPRGYDSFARFPSAVPKRVSFFSKFQPPRSQSCLQRACSKKIKQSRGDLEFFYQ